MHVNETNMTAISLYELKDDYEWTVLHVVKWLVVLRKITETISGLHY